MNEMPEKIFEYALNEEAALRPEQPRELSDHWQPHILLERAAYLRKMARAGNGSASETLREYPQHTAILLFRGRSGEAEIHERFADLFYVLAGEATLVTGGTIVGAHAEGPGETRGIEIEGGVRRILLHGDVAHVPAGLPHQMILAGDKTLTCFVLKIQEQP